MKRSRRDLLKAVAALTVATGIPGRAARAQQPIGRHEHAADRSSRRRQGGAGRAADVGRGRQREGRAARAQGRVHRLRRPDQPGADAGDLHQAARRRQGRPADRPVWDGAHGADHAAREAARSAADGQLLVPGEPHGQARQVVQQLAVERRRELVRRLLRGRPEARGQGDRVPRRRPGIRAEPGERRAGAGQEGGPADRLHPELPAEHGRLLVHDPRHPRRQARHRVRDVVPERLGRRSCAR